MRIDSYSVSMSSQYYNLQYQSTEANIVKDNQTFEKDNSVNVSAIKQDSKELETNKELSIELSKAILKNINSESAKIVKDKFVISRTTMESQALNFSVEAKVVANGREFEISMDLLLSRSFIEKTQISAELVSKSLKDPLVISLDGLMPNLSSKQFSFDIDSDGRSDQISLLKDGSGFLALDKNNNGRIDNGSELFGTKSGDGFADLSKYDDDNNGWIDANDKIFDKLRIWQKTDNKDELLALGEVGIGAIFLGNTETPFSLKSSSNELLGEMRKSGIVLFESGRAGVISHIDLAVETQKNLNVFETLQKNSSLLKMNKIYVDNQNKVDKESEDDDVLTKLQKKIRTLESKLFHAKEGEKTSIETQIGVLTTQMLSLLNA
ncbi:MAG: hypothetical protein M0Q24_03920 [Sulfurimonas sp.]|uniref:hypothetical protein n=1 Tax=Sulfurimonas sp. TaxID=2022749 RepID=UPI0025D01FD9|nr:hypothetical protein [Sulfurimonas sp.]MCK9491214.1 hypothetical protein [Sulfurimonas sp.]